MKGEFLSQFAPSYVRNHKSIHAKNLRCFPTCADDQHYSSGFCGNKVIVHLLKDDDDDDEDDNVNLEAYAEFQVQSTSVVDRFPLLHQDIPVNSLDSLMKGTMVGNDRIVFSRDTRGWHYGWFANRSLHSVTLHEMVVYVVSWKHTTTTATLLLTLRSPGFEVLSRKRIRPLPPPSSGNCKRKKTKLKVANSTSSSSSSPPPPPPPLVMALPKLFSNNNNNSPGLHLTPPGTTTSTTTTTTTTTTTAPTFFNSSWTLPTFHFEPQDDLFLKPLAPPPPLSSFLSKWPPTATSVPTTTTTATTTTALSTPAATATTSSMTPPPFSFSHLYPINHTFPPPPPPPVVAVDDILDLMRQPLILPSFFSPYDEGKSRGNSLL